MASDPGTSDPLSSIGPPVDGDSGRWELLRALGAVCLQPPPASDPLCDALGIARWGSAEHTAVFLLDLSPHSSIYLGAEGGIGGIAAETAAGIWRTLGLESPGEADHLATLLALYTHLGESVGSCQTEAAKLRLEHARQVLLWEHLWSWVPAYLEALAGQPACPAAAIQWAAVLSSALDREARWSEPPQVLPSVLGDAPPPLGEDPSVDDLVKSVATPVSSGFILTFSDLTRCASTAGVGLRRGERRFALRAMLEQDPASTLSWLSSHARRWEDWFSARAQAKHPGVLIFEWWAQRAGHTARLLRSLL